MGYYQKYKMEYENAEGQQVKLLVEDTFSPNINPYNFGYTVVPAGGGSQDVIISFDTITGADNIRVARSSDGGATFSSFTDYSIPPSTSPITYDVAAGNYIYLVLVQFTDPMADDEPYVLNELDGATDEWEPSGDPMHMVVNNATAGKLSPIAGTQLVIVVEANDNELLNKLLRGTYSDRRYRATATINDLPFFRGFLLAADAEEPFLPTPGIRMTLTDGLGTLKNKALVKPDGKNPTGYNKLIKYIAWALQQTGQRLPINVAVNIRGEEYGTITDHPSDHFFNTHEEDAKTYEKEPGESEDSYTVLSKIFKDFCFVGLKNGEWFIKSFDEFDMQPDYYAVFDADGEFVQTQAAEYYNKNIGIGNDMKWAGETPRASFASPSKFARSTYRYETFKEVPCNINFERGTEIPPGSPTQKNYTIECWDKLYTDGTGDHASSANMYIVKEFVNGYEKNRYLKFEDNGVFNFIMSEGIPMKAKDKFTIDVSRRMESNIGGTGTWTDRCVQVRLYGNDGSFWTCKGAEVANPERKWYSCDSLFQTNKKYFPFEGDYANDDREAIELYDGESAEIPVDGVIKILVYCSSLFGGTQDTFIHRVGFTYIPYINGAHEQFTGQQHKVSGNSDAESVDDEVYMSDGPNLLTKGALARYNGTAHVLAGRFWNAAVFPAGPPDDSYLHPFGYIQIFNVWNQVRLLNRIFRGMVDGIESGSIDPLGRTDLPSIFHTYFLTDPDEHTNNKRFMLLDMDMDLNKCEMNATLREVYDTVIGKKYSDPYEFKYLTK